MQRPFGQYIGLYVFFLIKAESTSGEHIALKLRLHGGSGQGV